MAYKELPPGFTIVEEEEEKKGLAQLPEGFELVDEQKDSGWITAQAPVPGPGRMVADPARAAAPEGRVNPQPASLTIGEALSDLPREVAQSWPGIKEAVTTPIIPRGAAIGGQNLVAGYYSTIAALADALGIDRAERAADKIAGEWQGRAQAGKMRQAQAGVPQDFSQAASLADVAKYVAANLGEQTTYSLPAMGAAALTAPISAPAAGAGITAQVLGRVLPTLASAALVGVPMEVGQIRQGEIAAGKEPHAGKELYYGIPAGMLEALGEAYLGTKIGLRVTKPGVARTVGETIARSIKVALQAAGFNYAQELPTEQLQTALELLAQDIPLDSDYAQKQFQEVGAMVAATAPFIGGGMAGATELVAGAQDIRAGRRAEAIDSARMAADRAYQERIGRELPEGFQVVGQPPAAPAPPAARPPGPPPAAPPAPPAAPVPVPPAPPAAPPAPGGAEVAPPTAPAAPGAISPAVPATRPTLAEAAAELKRDEEETTALMRDAVGDEVEYELDRLPTARNPRYDPETGTVKVPVRWARQVDEATGGRGAEATRAIIGEEMVHAAQSEKLSEDQFAELWDSAPADVQAAVSELYGFDKETDAFALARGEEGSTKTTSAQKGAELARIAAQALAGVPLTESFRASGGEAASPVAEAVKAWAAGLTGAQAEAVSAGATAVVKGGQPSAQAVRSDTGQVQERGDVGGRGAEPGRGDLQQPPSQPAAPAARQEEGQAGQERAGVPGEVTTRPTAQPAEPSPTAPPGPRWAGDMGAMPGEAMYFLDGETIEDAKAAVWEEPVGDEGEILYAAGVQSADGTEKVARFTTLEEAAKWAEEEVDGTVEAAEVEQPAGITDDEYDRGQQQIDDNPPDISDPPESDPSGAPTPASTPDAPTTQGRRPYSRPTITRIDPYRGGPIQVEQYPNLDPTQRAWEAGFALYVQDTERLVQDYEAIPDTEGGKIIAADLVKELSGAFSLPKEEAAALSTAVHKPGTAAAKWLWKRKLQQPVAPGARREVILLAGGPGSGKTTTLNRFVKNDPEFLNVHAIWDGALADVAKTQAMIEEAKAAGFKVTVVFVYRGFQDAAVGIVTRAQKTGRMVPIPVAAQDHIDAVETARKNAEKYKNDPMVDVRVGDNASPTIGDVKTFGGAEAIDFLKDATYLNPGETVPEATRRLWGAARRRMRLEGLEPAPRPEGMVPLAPPEIPAELPAGLNVDDHFKRTALERRNPRVGAMARGIDRLYVEAAKTLPSFVEDVKAVAGQFGAEAGIGGIKTRKRLIRKAPEYDYKLDGFKDIIRATITANSMADVPAILDALQAQADASGYKVIKRYDFLQDDAKLNETDRDKITRAFHGYRDAKFVVQRPNGVISEVIVITPELKKAKKQYHKDYADLAELKEEYERRRRIGEWVGTDLSRPMNLLAERQRRAYAGAFERDKVNAERIAASVSGAAYPNPSLKSAQDTLAQPGTATEATPPSGNSTVAATAPGSPSSSETPGPQGVTAITTEPAGITTPARSSSLESSLETTSPIGVPPSTYIVGPEGEGVKGLDEAEAGAETGIGGEGGAQDRTAEQGEEQGTPGSAVAMPGDVSVPGRDVPGAPGAVAEERPAAEDIDREEPRRRRPRKGTRGPGSRGPRGNRRDSLVGDHGLSGVGDEGNRPDGDGGRGRPESGYVAPLPSESVPRYVPDAADIAGRGRTQQLKDNIAAIELLKTLNAEKRKPTAAEQEVLGRYGGWGQFPQLFAASGAAEYSQYADRLHELLTDEELEYVRASTLNAHYTSPEVIEFMWKLAQQFGFNKGRVLEPAAGTGRFIGLMPLAGREGSKITQVELDPITGQIASMLYPETDVRITGFQNVNFPDGYFDLAISNVPFGDYRVPDPRYTKLRANIHDYFFIKSLDQVRPGGLVMFITSTGSLEKQYSGMRKEMAKRADLVAAIRLPQGTFQKTAGTQVVTDILIFRKRPDGTPYAGEPFLEVNHGLELPGEGGRKTWTRVNEYWKSHPEHIAGQMEMTGSMYGANELTTTLDLEDLPAELSRIAGTLPSGIFEEVSRRAAQQQVQREAIPAGSEARNGGFAIVDGKPFMRVGPILEPVELTPKNLVMLKDYLELRDTLRDLYRAQLEKRPDAEIEKLRKQLNTRYDAFVKKHGHLNDKGTKTDPVKGGPRAVLSDDADYFMVAAIESFDKKKRTGKKNEVFTANTVAAADPPTSASNIADAFAASVTQYGSLNDEYVAKLLGISVKDAQDQLVEAGLAFVDPLSGNMEPSYTYLAGNVRAKLEAAREAAKNDPQYQRNVDALTKIMPADIVYTEIVPRAGAGWISREMHESFINDILGLGTSPEDANNWILVNRVGGEEEQRWVVETRNNKQIEWAMQQHPDWSAAGYNAAEIWEMALNNSAPVVRIHLDEKRTVIDEEKTALVRAKIQEMRERFSEWIFEDPRRDAAERAYNEALNNYVPGDFTPPAVLKRENGYQFPEMSPSRGLRDYQARAVWQGINQGRQLVAHEMGLGKTMEMVVTAHELRRLGRARKPLIATPNRVVGQVAAEYQRAYPTANIIVIPGGLEKKERQRRFALAAASDPDVIVVGHTVLELLAVTPAVQAEFIRQEIAELEAVYESLVAAAASAPGGKRGKAGETRAVKALEKRKKKLEEALSTALKATRKDDAVYFDEIGIDALLIDEAHNFKSLPIYTTAENVKGIPSTRSDRATDMLMRVRFIQNQSANRNVFFYTGTPITNTLAEAYILQRYLTPDVLKEAGVYTFDEWSAAFATVVSRGESTAEGTYKTVSRLAMYINVPQLQQMLAPFMDTAFADQYPQFIKRPARKDVAVRVPITDVQIDFIKRMKRRAEHLRMGKVDPKEDNWLKLSTDAQKNSLDPRLADPDLREDPGSKVNRAAEEIYKVYTDHPGTTQMVFVDKGAQKGKKGEDRFFLVGELVQKLVDRGIPRDEIVDMGTVKSEDAVMETLAKMRRGDIRVMIGTRSRIGEGLNVQDKLKAMHHLDVPWTPARLNQADARGWRHGNENKQILIFRYITEGRGGTMSYDTTMWSTVERKDKFINQFMRGQMTAREVRDYTVDEDSGMLDPAILMAIAAGDERFITVVELEDELKRLEREYAGYRRTQGEQLRESKFQEEAATAQEQRAETARKREKYLAEVIQPLVLPENPVMQFGEWVRGSGQGKLPAASFDSPTQEAKDAYLARVVDVPSYWKWREIVKIGPISVEAKESYGLSGKTKEIEFRAIDENGDVISGWLGGGLQTALNNVEPEFQKRIAEANETSAAAARKRAAALRTTARKKWPKEDKLKEVASQLKALQAELEGLAAPTAPEPVDEGGPEVEPWPDEGEGPVSVSAATDPLAAVLGQLFGTRPRPAGVAIPTAAQARAEVEERLQAAAGAPRLSFAQKAKEAADRFVATFRRHFPDLDPKDPVQAQVADTLRTYEQTPAYAQAVAYRMIDEITKGLSKEQFPIFGRVLIMRDILKDIEAGLYADKPLPFGFADEQEVRSYLGELEQFVASNPALQRALDLRDRLVQPVTRKLVELDLLPAEVLSDPRYYHRQVMEYLQVLHPGLRSEDVRQHTKGFQKGRTGGGDFNTNYLESEFEWLSQALAAINKKETLDRVQKTADIKAELKAQAKASNERAFNAKVAGLSTQQQEAADEAMKGFKVRVAMNLGKLKKLADQGQLPIGPFGATVARLQAGTLAGDEQLFPYLKWLVDQNGSGVENALGIFKAISERTEYVKQMLGKEYKTWRSMVPDGYRIWQPEKGRHFFMGATVEEKVLGEVLAGNKALEDEDVRRVLMVGGPREEWVLPEPVANLLDKFDPWAPAQEMEGLWRNWLASWKQWTLLNPLRALRYNVNNLSGDADIVMAYDPTILGGSGKAASDLWSYFVSKNPSRAVAAEIEEGIRLGVLQSGLTVAEIPEINQAGALKSLSDPDGNVVAKSVQQYWDSVRNFTVWRENTLRLAAWRKIRKEVVTDGKRIYGASRPDELDAMYDAAGQLTKWAERRAELERVAAKVARELVGDYGNISAAGQWLRQNLMPFYSWIEINSPRYLRLLRNAASYEGRRGAGAVGSRFGAVGAKKLAMFALKAQALYFLISLWNHLMFPDEEKELRKQGRRQTHLIMGRDSDGNIRSIRFQGALSDMLDWLNLQDWMWDARDLIEGKADAIDKLVDAPKAAVSKVINAWEPLSKTVFEVATGQSTYPNIFREGKEGGTRTRPIRDPYEHIARTFSVDRLYNRITGKPRRKLPAGESALDLLMVYKTNPGEAAYWDARGLVEEWAQKNLGRDFSGGGKPTARGNALYYYKRALQWGDDDAAERWWKRYIELGGTVEGATRSIEMAAPDGLLPRMHRERFRKSLKGEDLESFKMAEEWYQKWAGSGEIKPRLNQPDDFEEGFKRLSLQEAEDEWIGMTVEEQDRVRRTFVVKIDNQRKKTKDPEERARLLELRRTVVVKPQ